MAGKVVLITGAASGLGEKLAYEYARQGARLSLVDINKENLVAVADMARSLGSPHVIIIGADVSKVQDSKQFVDETVNNFGQLDHLVNNAGVGGDPTLIEDSLDVTKYTSIIASLRIIPMGSTFECAKEIVRGACRGDMYVTNPSWVKVIFPFKVLYPELVDWIQQHAFGLFPKSSSKKENLHILKNNQVLKEE
ncbi:hypothetical protein TSUD_76140 [Trifolium subterraneum]|uniref:Uncharacterized protein n=1 Tax=Trifolium subterraneum TaxID=3900 RepID=A0A2Z6P558_TRISU|nr:hypothetical protein TSUD_76140 [Trifolium subterraneum]